MATLALTKIFINRMSDGAVVSAYSSTRSRNHAMSGAVQTYGDGRLRAHSSPGIITFYQFNMELITQTDIDTLRLWMGDSVQVRDNRGNRYVGTFFEIDIPAEYKTGSITYQITIKLFQVTWVDGV